MLKVTVNIATPARESSQLAVSPLSLIVDRYQGHPNSEIRYRRSGADL